MLPEHFVWYKTCYADNPKKAILAGTLCTGTLCTLPIATVVCLVYGTISHLANPTAAHNITTSDSNISTIRPLIPANRTISATPNRSIILSSIAPTQAGFILNATEVDPGALAINGKPFELTTNATPADGIIIKDSMVLEEDVWKDIMDSGFSTKRIQHWLNQGLNIDAKETDTGGHSIDVCNMV